MPSPAFTSSQCRSAFRCSAVVSSTVCMIPYAAQFVNKYFSLFPTSFAFRIRFSPLSELFGVVFSALFKISVLFPNYKYFSASGREKGDLSFFDMLLNFSVYLQCVFSVLYVLFETFQCFSEIFETGPNDYKNDSYYTVKVFTFTPLKRLPAFSNICLVCKMSLCTVGGTFHYLRRFRRRELIGCFNFLPHYFFHLSPSLVFLFPIFSARSRIQTDSHHFYVKQNIPQSA